MIGRPNKNGQRKTQPFFNTMSHIYTSGITHPLADLDATEKQFEELRMDVPEVDAFYTALDYISGFIDISLNDSNYWEKRDSYTKQLMNDPNIPSVAYPCSGFIGKNGKGRIVHLKWNRKEDVVRWLIAKCVKH